LSTASLKWLIYQINANTTLPGISAHLNQDYYSSVFILLTLMNVVVDTAAHFEHGMIIRCDFDRDWVIREQ
jgi:hypothetical protein